MHVYRAITPWVARRLYNGLADAFRTSSWWSGIRLYGEIIYFDAIAAVDWGAQQGIAIVSDSGMHLALLNNRTVLNIGIWGESANMELAQQAVRELWQGVN